MSNYSAYENGFFFISSKHSYETYSAVILEAPTGGYEQFNPLHMEAFGIHGSPIQFFCTLYLALIAMAADATRMFAVVNHIAPTISVAQGRYIDR